MNQGCKHPDVLAKTEFQETFKVGFAVKVRKVCAYSSPSPLSSWFSGYRIHAICSHFITVQNMVSGIVSNYSAADVQHAS